MSDSPIQEVLRETLVCPKCRKGLHFPDDAALCTEHGAFPAVNEVLSFLPGMANHFDAHWSAARNAPRAASKRKAAEHFLAPMLQANGMGTVKMLDVGCGDGVHIEVLSEATDPPDMIGLDVSLEALMMAREIPADWLPVHGDAQELPFADASFDVTISFGVQALLDNPLKGLDELVRVTKPGGMIGVWFALQRRDPAGYLLKIARYLVPRMSASLQRVTANLLVPFLGLMPTSSGLSLKTGSWGECREVILVNLTPRKIWYPSAEDLKAAFQTRDCEIFHEDSEMVGSLWVRKAPAAPE